jgi:glutamine amidotransferase
MIKIVNYGSGNIQAILNIYKRLNIECQVANTPDELLNAKKIILPGVGAFDETMRELLKSGFKESLDQMVLKQHTPIIGVCVGMQILGNKSEEGTLSGLGYIDGEAKKFDTKTFTQKPFLPHLGWNSISIQKNHQIFNSIDFERGFYFLHTYYFECNSEANVLAKTNYGIEFSSAVINANIFGIQFHPEKSHSNGEQLFKNFAEI